MTEEQPAEEVELFEEIEEEEPMVGEQEEEPLEEIEGPYIIWNVNSNYEIDLNEYFQDPDGDRLYFSSSLLDNIQVDINEEGIATLIPRKNWYGHEKIIFTADDNKGGIIKSDEITLVVTQQEEMSLARRTLKKAKDFLLSYYPYMIAGVVILAAAIFALAYTEQRSKSGSKIWV